MARDAARALAFRMRRSELAFPLVLAVAAACGGAGPSNDGLPTSPTRNDAGGADAQDAGALGSTSPTNPSNPGNPGSSSPEGGAPVTPPGSSNEAGAPGDGAVSGTPTLPVATGTCPTIANGDATFAPAGIPTRAVTISMTDAAKTKHGPLIFYWYATGSSVAEVEYALGSTLTDIEAAGGIVVAPHADPNAGEFEWYAANGSTKMDDFLVADEVVACIAASVGIDTTHIHTMGMSAGALQTTAMSYLRSDYLASVVTYSGGMPPGFSPPNENASNKFAALIFDGGSTDMAFGVDFQAGSEAYQANLSASGHFTAICDHGMGHAIPTAAAPSVWLFFQANGFGVSPSPYANGLPSSFPSYCTL
jgi:predicted esterase